MLGLFLTDVEPFHTVYLHGSSATLRAEDEQDQGQRGRSAGDDRARSAPMPFGWRSSSGNAPGVDQRLTERQARRRRATSRNKLWNAARFVLGARPEPIADRGRADARRALDPLSARRGRRPRHARSSTRWTPAAYAATAHEFAWSDYCDWYLEMAKVDLRRDARPRRAGAEPGRPAAEPLADLLRLLHPLLPFVTEEVWELARRRPRAGHARRSTADPRRVARRGPRGCRDRPRRRSCAWSSSAPSRDLRTAGAGCRAPGCRCWSRRSVGPAERRASGGASCATSRRWRVRGRSSSRRTRRPAPHSAGSTPLGMFWLGTDAAADAAADRTCRGASQRAAGAGRASPRALWPTISSPGGLQRRLSSENVAACRAGGPAGRPGGGRRLVERAIAEALEAGRDHPLTAPCWGRRSSPSRASRELPGHVVPQAPRTRRRRLLRRLPMQEDVSAQQSR